jgi:hypothetical protein
LAAGTGQCQTSLYHQKKSSAEGSKWLVLTGSKKKTPKIDNTSILTKAKK